MTILVTNPYHKDSLTELKSSFNIVHTTNRNELMANISDASGLLIRSKTQIDQNLLSKADKLKFIATATSGLDHINLKLCEQKNIEVFNPKEVNSISAAEHSFALLLAITKNLSSASQSINNNKWRSELSRGSDLFGKTIGIIGLGRVGSKVAKMAQAFNMKVIAYDPYKDESYFKTHSTTKISDLNKLISMSDVISTHTPLTDETKNLLNETNLKMAKKNCVLVNTSRGTCINELHLIQLLKDKTIKAAALDVFETEPISNHNELLKLDNVLLSPHIGAYTEEAFKNASFECTNWLKDKLFPIIV